MEQQHLIHRQSWHITATTTNALALQAKVAGLVQSNELQKQLSDAFDALVSPQEWLVLERLDIQLHNLPEEELEPRLIEQVVRQVREQLEHQKAKLLSSNYTAENSTVNFSAEERTLKALCYFLKNGVLPWWYEVSGHEAFETDILKSFEWVGNAAPATVSGAVRAQVQSALASATGARRLVNQFSDNILAGTVSLLLSAAGAAAKADALAAYREFESIIQAQNKQAFQHKLFELKVLFLANISAAAPAINSWLTAMIKQLEAEQVTALLEAVFKSKLLKSFVKEQVVPQKREFIQIISEKQTIALTPEATDNNKERIAEGVVIKNAGLILAAPFLPGLFSACKLMSESKLIYVDKAIALLHYLVFGHLDYREYETLLNKVLCGVTETENIALVTELSEAEKQHVEELLRAMISHWGALKNTSPDGLREGFLQRRGNLIRKEETWLLQVEQNTLDILLQQLPWTISYLKLPWMKELLRTDWA
ncbi:hypothetical protein FVR03_05210 [Pontibacter qinzhouensis]|uniref:Uncharacterized protein n=1 Tax=Pontibacter qinzhouensis TaxID=2603253 RepID=A0A5C8KD91_9BACT|nr:contractile injection system tape measure protein [Pontibacter qinzhouensis]TXK50290.1 hypothetical protein FVR03_05210 [Pontibacter qinzhouensis]